MNVGELHALITADGTQFDRAIDKSGRKFDAFASQVQRGTKAVATLFAGTTTAALGLGTAAFKIGLEYNKLQQNSRAALTTILGSGKAAADQMDRLDRFAKTSPFAKSVFISAQQQLLAFGMEAKKVIPTMDAVQQAVAAAGGSSQQLSDVIFVLAQIQAAGKITAQDLMQLGQRGINAAELIGSAMGKTGPEIKAMITKGTLGAEQALDALTKGMATKFGGATAGLKKQADGAFDRIKAGWREIGALMARPFINPTSGGWFVTWGNQAADILQAVRAKIEPLLALAEVKAGPALRKITDGLTKMRQGVDRIDLGRLVAGLENVSQYGPLIAGVATALFTLGAGSIPVLGQFVGAVNPAVAGLAALVATHPGLREVAKTFGHEFAAAAPHLLAIAKAAADAANPVIDALVPGLEALARVAPTIASTLAALLVPAIEATGAVAVPVAQAISLVAEGISHIPTPVLTAVAAFVALHKAIALLQGVKSVQAVLNFGRMTADIMANYTASGMLKIGWQKAAGAARGLGGALKGLMFNPLGLAITAVSTALGIFAKRKQEAKARTDELTAALKESNGVWSQNAKDVVASQLASTGAAAAYERMGGNARDLVLALTGTSEEAKRANDAIAEVEKTQRRTSSYTGLATVTNDWRRFSSAMDGVRSTTEEAVEAERVHRRMTEQATEAINEQVASLREQADALRDTANAAMESERAQAKWQEGLDAISKKIAEVRELEKEHGRALLETKDAWDLSNEAGRRAQEIMASRIDQGRALIETDREAGKGAEALAARRKEVVDALVQEATQFGWNEAAARSYVEKLLGIPKDVATKAELDASQAIKDTDNLVLKINKAEGTVTVNGNALPADTTLAKLVGKVNESDGTVDILGDKYPGEMTLEQFTEKIKGSSEQVKVGANTAAGESTVYTFRSNAGKGITINVSADTSSARWAINNLPKNHVIKLISSGVPKYLDPGFSNAHGSIMEYYARGGLRSENHVAQIAPAGAWRVWAEEETGGEAYIPLAAAKRARSTSILAEVADRFGYQLVQRFDQGGYHRPTPPPAATSGTTITATLDAATIGQVIAEKLGPVTEESIRAGFTEWLARQYHESTMGGGI